MVSVEKWGSWVMLAIMREVVVTFVDRPRKMRLPR